MRSVSSRYPSHGLIAGRVLVHGLTLIYAWQALETIPIEYLRGWSHFTEGAAACQIAGSALSVLLPCGGSSAWFGSPRPADVSACKEH